MYDGREMSRVIGRCRRYYLKLEKFNVHTIPLKATQMEYDVLFGHFECAITLATEEAKD